MGFCHYSILVILQKKSKALVLAMSKTNRLEAIRAILLEQQSATQAEILEALTVAGYNITQPTLSTDLKALHAAKVRTRNGTKYILPTQKEYQHTIEPTALPVSLQVAGISHHAFASSILVLTTKVGYAGAIAAEIDSRELQGVAGTIAGSDTVFISLTEDADKEAFLEKIKKIFPTLAS